jgi:hypothetical protein
VTVRARLAAVLPAAVQPLIMHDSFITLYSMTAVLRLHSSRRVVIAVKVQSRARAKCVGGVAGCAASRAQPRNRSYGYRKRYYKILGLRMFPFDPFAIADTQ